jgi:hypothetical protein
MPLSAIRSDDSDLIAKRISVVEQNNIGGFNGIGRNRRW